MGWRDVEIRESLAAATGLPIQFENSGKACALSQVWPARGDAAAISDLAFVTVSDGVGVGIIAGGEVLRGRHNIAGEFGHVPLNIDGPRCSCGATGCWETYISNLPTLSRYWNPGVRFDADLRRERPPANSLTGAHQMGDRLTMEPTKHPITAESCVVRNTNASKGRTHSITPGATAARHLHYGRIILDAGDAAIRFSTAEQETSLICLKGNTRVTAEGTTFELGRYDSLYVPRDSEVEVVAEGEGCDIA